MAERLLTSGAKKIFVVVDPQGNIAASLEVPEKLLRDYQRYRTDPEAVPIQTKKVIAFLEKWQARPDQTVLSGSAGSVSEFLQISQLTSREVRRRMISSR
jgi:hypothetical protein